MSTWILAMSAKKVIIEKNDLSPLSPNGEYLLRYRIISEDKNRTSHWSPIYTLDLKKVQKGVGDTAPDLTFAASNISTTSNLINKEHNFIVGQMVMFSSGEGTAPNTNFGLLSAGVPYYVRPVSSESFSLWVSEASALGETGLVGYIDFLSTGTGSAFTLTSNTKNLIRSVTSSIEVTPSDIISTWGDANQAPLYDIFVSYKIGGTWRDYFWHGSSPIHTYGFLQPTDEEDIGYGATDIRIAIQIAGIEKVRSSIITISIAEKSLQPIISGGSA
jgi:hypothetical protein